MKTINFDKQFAPMVQLGSKRQTIRKGTEIKAGDVMEILTGKRLLRRDACVRVIPIKVEAHSYVLENDTRFCDIARKNGFAKSEGFKGWIEFTEYMEKLYGLPFEGVVITW